MPSDRGGLDAVSVIDLEDDGRLRIKEEVRC